MSAVFEAATGVNGHQVLVKTNHKAPVLLNMHILDTGKVKIFPHEDRYLIVSIYADDEINEADITLVREYLDQFEGRVSVLVKRDGHYSLSHIVQLALMLEAGKRFEAVAYLDRTHLQRDLTDFAKNTYLKDVKVRSFSDEKDADHWLRQFSPVLFR